MTGHRQATRAENTMDDDDYDDFFVKAKLLLLGPALAAPAVSAAGQ